MDLVLIELHYPGIPPTLAGFLLFDEERRQLEYRCLQDWSFVPDPDDRKVLEATESMIRDLASEVGPGKALQVMEDQLSNVLRLSTRLCLHTSNRPIAHLAEALAGTLLIGAN